MALVCIYELILGGGNKVSMNGWIERNTPTTRPKILGTLLIHSELHFLEA